MHCAQKTPSVHFHFQDNTRRKEFSSHLFDLSNTSDKYCQQIGSDLKTNHILFQNMNFVPAEPSKLKTEQFFQQFDNNFVVTFDSEAKNPESASPHRLQRNIDLQSEQNHEEIVSFANQPLNKTNSEFNAGGSLEPRKIISEKEKSSPIPSFEVKKRTVFKSKNKIKQNSQQFKITKKKTICNKQTLETFGQSKSCKVSQKQQDKGFYLSLKVWKAFDNEQSRPEPKSKSTIFQHDFQSRQTMGSTLRSTTLEYWRKKFDRKRSYCKNEKTVKRHNIFQRPFSHKH